MEPKRTHSLGRIAGWLPLPGVILLIVLISGDRTWVESAYSRGLYPLVSSSLRGLLGWLPFSVGDLLYTLFFLGILRFVGNGLRRPWSLKGLIGRTQKAMAWIAGLVAAFYFFWGLNYFRAPLEDTLGIEVVYSESELREIADHLLERTLFYHRQTVGNDTILISIPYSHRQIYRRTAEGYQRLNKEWDWVNRVPRSSIKSSLYSTPLSYMGYGGYLNPFTGEAQVNRNLPKFLAPVLSGHEAGHQLGFASEGDTNFIGQLVSIRNPDPYFKYSGYSAALRYVLSDLSARDREAFDRIWSRVPKGIRKEYRELAAYQAKYSNPFEPLFERTFDVFLKMNKQPDGIRSYSRVVGLLIGYHRLRTL